MRKALYSQFTIGIMFYYGITIVGYWTYGSMVYAYLPQNFNGPRWINVLINAIVLLQSITSQHVCIILHIFLH
ncbi:putative amino acid transporter, transmembrane domain-containing protein [Lupinus albus]|uniref:Putative amino acid transporter, transmembrane domain-containing protein n=1 Tax=Lupinus albus TaxID=3870 RepID=A0A6A4Q8J9_LUPAL|nr:putative amino acid transporter, transmembrane domain-containing protein [Lupinus albus]